MALRWGINITASDMRKYLEENERQQNGIRSWRQLFGNAGLRYNSQVDMLKSDYASAIADAYQANLRQRNAIFGAGYSEGTTNAFLADNRNDLLSAYDAYIRNYNSAVDTVRKTYSDEISALDEELNTRAENFSTLYNSVYDYLSQELAGSYQTFDEGVTKIDYLTDQGLGWTRHDDGTLKTWNELSYQLFNADDGTLTDVGKQFYNRIFNDIPQGWIRDDDKSDTGTRSMRGFDEWLSNTNPELREWWVSGNEYGRVNEERNKDVADKAIGIVGMNPIDTSVKQPTTPNVPGGTSTTPNVPGGTSTASWNITGLGTGRKSGKGRSDRFTLNLHAESNVKDASDRFAAMSAGTEYKMKTIDNVSADLVKKLNQLSTGGENTSPSAEGESWLGGTISSYDSGKSNKIVVYQNKMYIYTKNGWREAISNDNKVSTQTVIDRFLKGRTTH